MPILELFRTGLSEETLFRQAGRAGTAERLRPRIREALEEARGLIRLRAAWVLAEREPLRPGPLRGTAGAPGASTPGAAGTPAVESPGEASPGLCLRDPDSGRRARLPGAEAARLLGPASRVLAAVATLGDRLGARIAEREAREDLLGAFFLDACGALALETLSRDLCRLAAERAADLPGRGCSPLLHPGSVPGLDLSLQGPLVHLVGADLLGVTVDARCLMVPRHSLSLLIGLGDYPHREPPASCVACSRADCPYRSAPAGGAVA